MDDKEIRYSVDQIMLRAAAISGCATPETDYFAGIICEELSTFILDFGFRELTLSEIFLAIRTNAKIGTRMPSGIDMEQVHFSGSYFSVGFIAKILANYSVLRNNLDRRLQNYIDGHPIFEGS